METLVVVEQHKIQYYSTKSKPQGHGSSPSRDFRGINCRTFQSRTGILPIPLKSHSYPKTPSPTTTPAKSNPDDKTYEKTTSMTTPIPINARSCRKETTFCEDVLLSELWAGATYSNSPPPSSLPIPKFSVRPKRTVSLDLPGSSPEFEMSPMAKSAPPSPSREHSPSTRDLFVNANSATQTLRRILNLNIDDE